MHKRALKVSQAGDLRPYILVRQPSRPSILWLTFPVVQEACSIHQHMAPVVNALAVLVDLDIV